MNQKHANDLASNRRAFHDYEILETFEAGLVLTGTEIKSLRNGGGNLQEGYVKALGGALWLIGASIAPYSFGGVYNHEERRDRKLLMHKREIARLQEAVSQKGLTLVPLALYLNKGKVKLKLGLAKGKKRHDKRSSLIEKESQRDMQRAIKKFV